MTGAFPDWFTERHPAVAAPPGPGMRPRSSALRSSPLTATAIAVPLGIVGAVYLNEYGKNSALARVLRFLTNVMTGVPSIVMGLFIYVFWVVPRGVDGLNGFSGALALACLMLPIVVRSSRGDAAAGAAAPARGQLRARRQREPHDAHGGAAQAAPGIISGCLLAVARAAGETAPLLFTIGAAKATNWNLFGGTNTALSMQIYGNAKESFANAQERAWGAALTLDRPGLRCSRFAARILTARLSRNR